MTSDFGARGAPRVDNAAFRRTESAFGDDTLDFGHDKRFSILTKASVEETKTPVETTKASLLKRRRRLVGREVSIHLHEARAVRVGKRAERAGMHACRQDSSSDSTMRGPGRLKKAFPSAT